MNVEPIGILVAIVGIYAMFAGLKVGAYVLCFSALLGAAAAIIITALGGASVQPAHFSLLFLSLGVLLRPKTLSAALSCLAFPGPGFWFLLFTLYSVLTAVFLPRIFEGATLVYAFARDTEMQSIIAVPISPQTGNVTQAVYMLGGLVCFAIVAGFGRLGGSPIFARALVFTGALCVFFAIADVVTYLTDSGELLAIIRNANYRMLNEGEVGDFKRIVGSFPEASAYGYTALALFAFILILNLEGFPARHTGLVAAALAISLVLCTSTTAYVAGAATVMIVLAYCFVRIWQRQATGQHFKFIATCLIVLPLLVMLTMMNSALRESFTELMQATVMTKLESDSGLERMRWNAQAFEVFLATDGMGAGLGSVRASSFVIALLASVGVLGTALFCIFFGSLTFAVLRRPNRPRVDMAVGYAALLSCVAQLLAAVISAGAIDLGLVFCISAGLACAYGAGELPEAGRAHNEGALPLSALPASRFSQFLATTALMWRRSAFGEGRFAAPPRKGLVSHA